MQKITGEGVGAVGSGEGDRAPRDRRITCTDSKSGIRTAVQGEARDQYGVAGAPG